MTQEVRADVITGLRGCHCQGEGEESDMNFVLGDTNLWMSKQGKQSRVKFKTGKSVVFQILFLSILLLLQLTAIKLLKDSEILITAHISLTLLIKRLFIPEMQLSWVTAPMICSVDKSQRNHNIPVEESRNRNVNKIGLKYLRIEVDL